MRIVFICAVALALLAAVPALAMDGECKAVTCFDGSVHPCGFDCSSLARGPGGGMPAVIVPAGPSPEELRRMREGRMYDLNDLGADAYAAQDYVRALAYFEESLAYDPHNPTLLDNVVAARERLIEAAERNPWVPAYLASANTALGLYSVTPGLLVLHPSPSVREEAERQLAERTMQQIADAAADYVIGERRYGRVLEAFRQDSAETAALKRRIVINTASEVEALRTQAHIEAREKALGLQRAELSGMRKIGIVPGPALADLIAISIAGFK